MNCAPESAPKALPYRGPIGIEPKAQRIVAWSFVAQRTGRTLLADAIVARLYAVFGERDHGSHDRAPRYAAIAS